MLGQADWSEKMHAFRPGNGAFSGGFPSKLDLFQGSKYAAFGPPNQSSEYRCKRSWNTPHLGAEIGQILGGVQLPKRGGTYPNRGVPVLITSFYILMGPDVLSDRTACHTSPACCRLEYRPVDKERLSGGESQYVRLPRVVEQLTLIDRGYLLWFIPIRSLFRTRCIVNVDTPNSNSSSGIASTRQGGPRNLDVDIVKGSTTNRQIQRSLP